MIALPYMCLLPDTLRRASAGCVCLRSEWLTVLLEGNSYRLALEYQLKNGRDRGSCP